MRFSCLTERVAGGQTRNHTVRTFCWTPTDSQHSSFRIYSWISLYSSIPVINLDLEVSLMRTESCSPNKNLMSFNLSNRKRLTFHWSILYVSGNSTKIMHQRQKQYRWSYLEGIISHCNDHILKEYLWGERMSMIDNGLSIGTIPAVHFYTSAATIQSPVR